MTRGRRPARGVGTKAPAPGGGSGAGRAGARAAGCASSRDRPGTAAPDEAIGDAPRDRYAEPAEAPFSGAGKRAAPPLPGGARPRVGASRGSAGRFMVPQPGRRFRLRGCRSARPCGRSGAARRRAWRALIPGDRSQPGRPYPSPRAGPLPRPSATTSFKPCSPIPPDSIPSRSAPCWTGRRNWAPTRRSATALATDTPNPPNRPSPARRGGPPHRPRRASPPHRRPHRPRPRSIRWPRRATSPPPRMTSPRWPRPRPGSSIAS